MYSKTNVYYDSEGNSYTSQAVKRKTSEACKEVMRRQRLEIGYNECIECGINDRFAIIDPSHDVSVAVAKETGRAELCWSKDNINPRCRDCHNMWDGLNLDSANCNCYVPIKRGFPYFDNKVICSRCNKELKGL